MRLFRRNLLLLVFQNIYLLAFYVILFTKMNVKMLENSGNVNYRWMEFDCVCILYVDRREDVSVCDMKCKIRRCECKSVCVNKKYT